MKDHDMADAKFEQARVTGPVHVYTGIGHAPSRDGDEITLASDHADALAALGHIERAEKAAPADQAPS